MLPIPATPPKPPAASSQDYTHSTPSKKLAFSPSLFDSPEKTKTELNPHALQKGESLFQRFQAPKEGFVYSMAFRKKGHRILRNVGSSIDGAKRFVGYKHDLIKCLRTKKGRPSIKHLAHSLKDSQTKITLTVLETLKKKPGESRETYLQRIRVREALWQRCLQTRGLGNTMGSHGLNTSDPCSEPLQRKQETPSTQMTLDGWVSLPLS